MFAWDEAKRLTNLRKHGIDFRDAQKIFRGFTLTAEDDRESYGERRFLTLGLLDDQVVSVAHSERDDNIRIISIRKATKHEARFY
ncbi:MAG: BrnT family toxin, partial [Cyanobium sp. ELA712]